MSDYHGHLTKPDGTHVPLSKEDANALWAAAEEARKRAEELLPDTAAVLSVMCSIQNRMSKLGWSEAMYCPKDETDFALITPGSSGIFRAFYSGKWPHGEIHVLDDTSSVQGCWWKPLGKLTQQEADHMERTMRLNEECIEGHVRRFATWVEDPSSAE